MKRNLYLTLDYPDESGFDRPLKLEDRFLSEKRRLEACAKIMYITRKHLEEYQEYWVGSYFY